MADNRAGNPNNSSTIAPPRSRSLRPGTIIVHKPTATAVCLGRRKDDGTGWWNTDKSGFSDAVLDKVDGDFLALTPSVVRALLDLLPQKLPE